MEIRAVTIRCLAILVLGIPLWVLVPATVMALLIFFFSERIYRMDMRLAYGSEMRKLEELIRDMEELRS